MNLRDRLPSRSDTFAVYSTIVFWSYSWGVLLFLFSLPSWMLVVSMWEILGYFSYGMVAIFLDTILMLGLVLGIALALPSAWLRNDFAAAGSALAGLLFFWITITQVAFGAVMAWPTPQLLTFYGTALVSMVIAVVAVRRLPIFRKIVLWLASSAGVFVYVYGFLSALGFVIVLIRNIF